MTASSSNPLLDTFSLPRFEEIRDEEMVAAMTSLLGELEAAFSNLEGALVPTYEGIVHPLEMIDARLSHAWGIVRHLHAVRSTDALRAAHAEVQPKVVSFSTRIGQSRAIHDGLLQVQAESGDSLSPAQKRVLERLILEAHNSGVGLDGEAKTRFNEIQTRLAELGSEFSNNVLDAIKSWSKRLTEKEEVAGIPKTTLHLFADNAKAEGDEGATVEEGPWLIGLNAPAVIPILRHAAHRALREEVYRAYVARAATDPYDNKPLLKEMLALRQEQATLLGYEHYAALSLSSKMAKDVSEVYELLDQVREVSWPAAQKELQGLQEFAEKKGFEGTLQRWDVGFYAERLREESFDFKAEEIRPYLPLNKVLDGLFNIIDQVFGVRLKEVPGTTQVWHKDVRFFELHDHEGTLLSSVFIDLFSRPKEKRPGAWMDECTKRQLLRGEDGEVERVVIPTAYVVANFAPPIGDGEALLTFEEAKTLFHEFGHALQHMLTTVNEGFAAGINGVEWDAVEVPSMFMEEWLQVPSLLQKLARHHKTGESIPTALMNKLLSARGFRAGSFLLRQLGFGLVDLTLHSNPTHAAAPFEAWEEIQAKTSPMPPFSEDRFLCAFSHIFSGGYSAGYYSYMWASIMSADAFEAFSELGFDDNTLLAEKGALFRKTFLSLGGSVHPAEVFQAFRGRPPITTPMLANVGLVERELSVSTL